MTAEAGEDRSAGSQVSVPPETEEERSSWRWRIMGLDILPGDDKLLCVCK